MYSRKIVDKILHFIDTDDILLFYGARQTWKTSLMEYLRDNCISKRSIFLDLENPDNLENLNQWPSIFERYLKSYFNRNEDEKIVLFIDEIQYLDNPTSFLKYVHDHYRNIKLITSGSSTLEIRNKFKDSLAWRLLKFDIFPLSFEEFLIFKDRPELAKFVWNTLEQDFPIIEKELNFYYKEYITFWSYPKIALTNWEFEKKEYIKQLYESYIQKDIKDIWKIEDIQWFNKLISVLASQVWNLVNMTEISGKIWISLPTLKKRFALLENTFVIKTIYPYAGNIRWELIKTPKIFFIDSWIRNYAANDFSLNWALFENSFFCYVNNAYKSNHINFFRTKEKQEVDFVLDDIPYELKLKYEWKWLLALSRFEEETGNKGKVITLDKWNQKGRESFYPREI